MNFHGCIQEEGETELRILVRHSESAIAATCPVARQMRSVRIPALILFCLSCPLPLHLPAQAVAPSGRAAQSKQALSGMPPILERRYQDREKIAYTISGINHSRSNTTEYEARVEADVRKDPSGIFVEEFAWTDLELNDEQVHLSHASRAFKDPLSLAPGFRLSVPDLSRVDPRLIGPITDLLTFYADAKIAMSQKGLMREGDRVRVPYGTPSSWADGTHIVIGQDSIDFDITLQSIDRTEQIATLVVRHVPPAQPQIKLPVSWMSAPVGIASNNWVQVEKLPDGMYVAAVGQETFNVKIKIALATGRIVLATMDNPVEVLERNCNDAALADCRAPVRYSIRRQITLDAQP